MKDEFFSSSLHKFIDIVIFVVNWAISLKGKMAANGWVKTLLRRTWWKFLMWSIFLQMYALCCLHVSEYIFYVNVLARKVKDDIFWINLLLKIGTESLNFGSRTKKLWVKIQFSSRNCLPEYSLFWKKDI